MSQRSLKYLMDSKTLFAFKKILTVVQRGLLYKSVCELFIANTLTANQTFVKLISTF